MSKVHKPYHNPIQQQSAHQAYSEVTHKINLSDKEQSSQIHKEQKKIKKFLDQILSKNNKNLYSERLQRHSNLKKTRKVLIKQQNENNLMKKVRRSRLPNFGPSRSLSSSRHQLKNKEAISRRSPSRPNKSFKLPKLSIKGKAVSKSFSKNNKENITPSTYIETIASKNEQTEKNSDSEFKELVSNFVIKKMKKRNSGKKSAKKIANSNFQESSKNYIRLFKSIKKKKKCLKEESQNSVHLKTNKMVILVESCELGIDKKKNNYKASTASASGGYLKKENSDSNEESFTTASYNRSCIKRLQLDPSFSQILERLPLDINSTAEQSKFLVFSQISSEVSTPSKNSIKNEKAKSFVLNQNNDETSTQKIPEPQAPRHSSKKVKEGGFSSYAQKTLNKKKFKTEVDFSGFNPGLNGIDIVQTANMEVSATRNENLKMKLGCPGLISLPKENFKIKKDELLNQEKKEGIAKLEQNNHASIQPSASLKVDKNIHLGSKSEELSLPNPNLIESCKKPCFKLVQPLKSILVNKNFHLPVERMMQPVQMIEISTQKKSKLLLPLWELEQADDQILHSIKSYQQRLSNETKVLKKYKRKNHKVSWKLTNNQLLRSEDSHRKRVSSPLAQTMKNKECVVRAQDSFSIENDD